ncbi:hypothetical protein P8452_73853 [Trifolium repens]|nr:hypothetical protein P8452_73853 [Trifolium repens]
MASSSSSRNMVPFAVDDKEPVIIDNSGFVSEPAMTSVESSVWGEELIIPHKLEAKRKSALAHKTLVLRVAMKITLTHLLMKKKI